MIFMDTFLSVILFIKKILVEIFSGKIAALKFKFPQLNGSIHFDLHEKIVILSYLFENYYPPKFSKSKIGVSTMIFMDTLGSAILFYILLFF